MALRWGTTAVSMASDGVQIPVIDGLLAATAMVHSLVIVTRNVDHFEMAGAAILNLWEDLEKE